MEAVKWWHVAALHGDRAAQNNLGAAYIEGEGVARNAAEAVRWWSKAAEQNDQAAERGLGIAYSYGDGVSKDLIRGYMWLSLALTQGDQEALPFLEKVEKSMNSGQIAEAKRLASEWKLQSPSTLNKAVPAVTNDDPCFSTQHTRAVSDTSSQANNPHSASR